MEITSIDSANRQPVKIGVIGLGRSFFTRHLPILRKLNGFFKLTAICDIAKERRTIVEKEFPDVHTYRQISDMLDDPDIDIIDIALPTADHVSVAIDSLNRNRWTMVETPIATSIDDLNRVRAAAVKSRNKLLFFMPEVFSPDFLLAKQVMAMKESPLDEIHEICVRNYDYIRRDDWQTIKRCGGGSSWYHGPAAVFQAYDLLKPFPPAQLWSELKRVASLGDAEDFTRIILRTRTQLTARIEINGGYLGERKPSFSLTGLRGNFSVFPGESEGVIRAIDPEFKFPRRRSSVRMPPLDDMHEQFPMVDIPVKLNNANLVGDEAFYHAVYNSVCKAVLFPVSFEEYNEVTRYLQIAKNSSSFSN